MSDTCDIVLGLCEMCGTDIEYVPTPEGADPAWFPPFWRHLSPAGHHAKPRPADAEAVR